VRRCRLPPGPPFFSAFQPWPLLGGAIGTIGACCWWGRRCSPAGKPGGATTRSSTLSRRAAADLRRRRNRRAMGPGGFERLKPARPESFLPTPHG
jgi:hypothetical protein